MSTTPKKTAKKQAAKTEETAAPTPKKTAKKAVAIEALPEGTLRHIDTDLIDPHPQNRPVDAKDCKELAQSMRYGQIEPAIVRPHPTKPGRFQLGPGHRRFHGAKINGMPLECIVRDLSDAQIEAMLAAENHQRQAPDPRQEAEQIRRLLARPGTSPEDVAGIMGKDDRWINRRIVLTRLTDDLHKAWIDPNSRVHVLPVGAMEILATLEPEMQAKFLTLPEWNFPKTRDAVAEWVCKQSCDLKDAKFLEDPATFIPGCGPGCACSSTASGLLQFEEFKDVKDEGGSCLKPDCFNKRKELFRLAQWPKVLANAPEGFVVIGAYNEPDLKLADGRTIKFQEEHKFNAWKACKKTDRGAVMFIIENRNKGSITKTYRAPPKGAKVTMTNTSGESVKSPEESLQASIDRCQGKRYTELLETLVAHVQGLPENFWAQGLVIPVVNLVAIFGTYEKQPFVDGEESLWGDATDLTENRAMTKLWISVKEVLLCRLRSPNFTNRKADLIKPEFTGEMRHIAAITGFDFDAAYASIANTLKMPAALKDLDVVTLEPKKAA